MASKDGGAAFPVSYGPDGTPGYSDGMSLRDWFAGQALAGWSESHHGVARHYRGDPYSPVDTGARSPTDAEAMALAAYEIADAMLAVRSPDSTVQSSTEPTP